MLLVFLNYAKNIVIEAKDMMATPIHPKYRTNFEGTNEAITE